MKKVLIVEDEYAIRDLLMYNLNTLGYDTVGAESAERALELYNADRDSFDVALLDIMLPGMDGLELCERIRRSNRRIGIIMLTAKAQEQDKIAGLVIGADDYVIKPFSIGELAARVEAVYRRATNTGAQAVNDEICCGEFVLDTRSRVVTKNGEPLELTQVEYQLMELFFKNPGVALDRESILKAVWGENYFGDVKIVDVNVCRMRIKVEDEPNNPQHLVTVWGFGYRWNS